MRNIVWQISLGVLLLSLLIYVAGRWVIPTPMSDDMGDWFLWAGGMAALILLFSTRGELSLDMRWRLNAITATTIVFLVAFGAWGLLSDSGQKQFPEMAGLFPFYALILAVMLLILLVIANLFWRRRLEK